MTKPWARDGEIQHSKWVVPAPDRLYRPGLSKKEPIGPGESRDKMGTEITTEHEVAQLLVDTLHLELSPHEILPDEPLFGDGLGLDSIDALEIALAISKMYGFALKSEEGRAQQVFASLRSLTRYIDAHRIR